MRHLCFGHAVLITDMFMNCKVVTNSLKMGLQVGMLALPGELKCSRLGGGTVVATVWTSCSTQVLDFLSLCCACKDSNKLGRSTPDLPAQGSPMLCSAEERPQF